MPSISAGYALNPPTMNMSLMRSVMRTLPRSSMTPMSPVCSQPSASIASAVAAGSWMKPAHDVVAAHHDLARLAGGRGLPVVVDDLDLDAGDRAPDVVGDRLGVVVVAAHRRDAGALGEPVAGHDRLEAELGAHPVDHLDRDRRPRP